MQPVGKLFDRLKRRQAANRPTHPQHVDFSDVCSFLGKNGVCEGDILIVHSSMVALKATGLSPLEIIEALHRVVGVTGTIAIPAFPLLRGQPSGAELLLDAAYAVTLTYDVARSPPWTGALAKAAIGIPGSVRSRHPCNSLVAIGAHAEAMMRHNIDDDGCTPCGLGSAWEYCYGKKAKIVALGVDLAHSLTMIHVAEDAFESRWPIKSWYRRRTFNVVDGDFRRTISVRERKHLWSLFYAERAFARDLRVSGIATGTKIGDLDVTFCESDKLVEHMQSQERPEYPYYIPASRLLERLLS